MIKLSHHFPFCDLVTRMYPEDRLITGGFPETGEDNPGEGSNSSIIVDVRGVSPCVQARSAGDDVTQPMTFSLSVGSSTYDQTLSQTGSRWNLSVHFKLIYGGTFEFGTFDIIVLETYLISNANI